MPATKPAKLPPTADSRCGTQPGRSAHQRRNELPCEACKIVERQRQQARRARDGGAGSRAQYRRSVAQDHGASNRARMRDTYATRRLRTPAAADEDFARLRPLGKPCPSCGELLPAEAFIRDWTTADGRERQCDQNGCRNRHAKLKRDRKLRDHWLALGLDPAKCLYCDAPAEDLEHVMPKALGGSDDFANLAPSCAPCNRGIGGKHDLHPLTWLQSARPDRLERVSTLFPHILQETS